MNYDKHLTVKHNCDSKCADQCGPSHHHICKYEELQSIYIHLVYYKYVDQTLFNHDVTIHWRIIGTMGAQCWLIWRNEYLLLTTPYRKVATRLNPFPWWRHKMETFSALMVFCAGNSPLTCDQWIPHTKASDSELWCFLWSWTNGWVNRDAGDFRRHRPHLTSP